MIFKTLTVVFLGVAIFFLFSINQKMGNTVAQDKLNEQMAIEMQKSLKTSGAVEIDGIQMPTFKIPGIEKRFKNSENVDNTQVSEPGPVKKLQQ